MSAIHTSDQTTHSVLFYGDFYIFLRADTVRSKAFRYRAARDTGHLTLRHKVFVCGILGLVFFFKLLI